MAWIKYAIWNKIAFDTTNLRQSSEFFFYFCGSRCMNLTHKRNKSIIFLSQTQTWLEKVVHWENTKKYPFIILIKTNSLKFTVFIWKATKVYTKNCTLTNYKENFFKCWQIENKNVVWTISHSILEASWWSNTWM